MLKTFNQTKTFYPFFLFLFTLLLTLSLALPWVSAQEPSKPKPQPWHIDGIIAALDDGHDKVKDYAFWQLIQYEPQELQAVIEKPEDEDIAEKAANILQNKTVDSHIRRLMVYALVNLGEAGVNYIPDMLNFLQDETVDGLVRGSAADALVRLGEAGAIYAPEIANIVQDETVDGWVRGWMADVLGNLGEAGAIYAPEIANILKDETADSGVRSRAANALVRLGEVGVVYIPDILNFLQDETVDSIDRSSTTYALAYALAYALSQLGEAGVQYIPEILKFIQDETIDSQIRGSAALSLSDLRKIELNDVIFILDNIYDPNQSDLMKQWRFFIYPITGGTDEVKTLLKWLGYPKATPTALNYEEGKKTLELFLQVWENAQELSRLQTDLAEKIAVVISLVSWKPQDIDLLQRHYNNLKAGNFTQADSVESVILNLKK